MFIHTFSFEETELKKVIFNEIIVDGVDNCLIICGPIYEIHDAQMI
jgi:hypothetical protein